MTIRIRTEVAARLVPFGVLARRATRTALQLARSKRSANHFAAKTPSTSRFDQLEKDALCIMVPLISLIPDGDQAHGVEKYRTHG